VLYTHYDYLELPPGSPPARIDAAYEIIKQRLNGHSNEMLVRLIHKAYAVLSDPKRRGAYDQALHIEAQEADAELKACLDQPLGPRPRHVQDVPAPLETALSAWAA
jgi:DnaJ-class molecular chaperone